MAGDHLLGQEVIRGRPRRAWSESPDRDGNHGEEGGRRTRGQPDSAHPEQAHRRPSPIRGADRRSRRAQGRVFVTKEFRQRGSSFPGSRSELAEGNRVYEARFGHIYLVCAAGRGAAELLQVLRERLRNDPLTERRVVRDELRKINELRLERLLGNEHSHDARA